MAFGGNEMLFEVYGLSYGRFGLKLAALFAGCVLAFDCAYGSVTGGFMHRDQTCLTYFRITQVGSHLSGFAQSVCSDLKVASGSRVTTSEFVGEASGVSFTLHSDTVHELFGGGVTRCAGTLRGSCFELTFPNAHGQVISQTFEHCSSEQWNMLLTKFSQTQLWASTYVWYLSEFKNHYQELKTETQRLQEEVGRADATISDLKLKLSQARTEYKAKIDELHTAGELVEQLETKYRAAQALEREAEHQANAVPSEAARENVKAKSEAISDAWKAESGAQEAMSRTKGMASSDRQLVERTIAERDDQTRGLSQKRKRMIEDNAEFTLINEVANIHPLRAFISHQLSIATLNAGTPVLKRPSNSTSSFGSVNRTGKFAVLPLA